MFRSLEKLNPHNLSEYVVRSVHNLYDNIFGVDNRQTVSPFGCCVRSEKEISSLATGKEFESGSGNYPIQL